MQLIARMPQHVMQSLHVRFHSGGFELFYGRGCDVVLAPESPRLAAVHAGGGARLPAARLRRGRAARADEEGDLLVR